MHALTRERRQDAKSAALSASADMLTGDLLSALRRGDLSAPALFAPMTRDFSAPLSMTEPIVSRQRHQTVGEVVSEMVVNPEDFYPLLSLICKIAYTAEPQATLAVQSRALLQKIATEFGEAYKTGEFE